MSNNTEISELFIINTSALLRLFDSEVLDPDIIKARITAYMVVTSSVLYIFGILKKISFRWNIVPILIEIGTSVVLMRCNWISALIFILVNLFWGLVYLVGQLDIRLKRE